MFNIPVWQHHVEAARRLDICPGRTWTGAEQHWPGDEDSLDEPGEVITITDRNVRAALANMEAPTSFDGVAADGVDEELRRRYARIGAATESALRATEQKRAAQEHIALRNRQMQQVAAAVRAIHRRAPPPQKHKQAGAGRQRRRREDIYRYVGEHLREAGVRAWEAEQLAARHRAELGVLRAVEDGLGNAMRRMALSVGLGGVVDPDEIVRLVSWMSLQAGVETEASLRGGDAPPC
ncbi:hypothetical protein CDD83_4768 [Cordyceps sp. RAO-2017]|nr:hypothetical protein CDD83_4768 [Cordyceps sp. RAO-2017]